MENVILGIAMMAFIPVFFFASIYGQIALGEKATTSSLLILYFFLGFVVRRADRRPDAGPDRGQAAGGARLRAGRGRVLRCGRAR